MQRLYKVATKTLAAPRYFDDKMVAKTLRDERKEAGEHCVVSRGPDHPRGETFNVSKQTPSSKRGW